MNASNEELPQEGQEQAQEKRTFYDPIEYAEQWFNRNRDRERTPEQREHVAQRTARKAREQAEASARWGSPSEEAQSMSKPGCPWDTDGDGNCGRKHCPYCGQRARRIERILDKPLGDMPNPTNADLNSPEFEAIWQVIKSWDVNVPEFYDGYCGANGSHAKLILDVLRKVTDGH